MMIKQFTFLQEGSNRILSKTQKSFWSCSHMNCCLQNILHINLHKYQENLLAAQKIFKLTQFNPTNCFCREQPNENSLIVATKFNPISSGPCVHFSTN